MPVPSRSGRTIWLLSLLAACGSLDLPSGQIECGPGGSCPRDMRCGDDGLCHTGAGGGPGEDDAAPGEVDADAGPPCTGGPLRDFTDDFDDLSAWTVVGGGIDTCSVVATAGGILRIATSEPGTCGIESVELFEFIDQHATLRIDDGNVNMGNPDLVFRVVLGGGSIQLVWADGAMSAMDCPDSGGCGTSGLPGDLRQWWRLRHDPLRGSVFAELSSNGASFPDGAEYSVPTDEATCARLFIGTTGQLTEEPLYPMDIDRLNIP